MEKWQNQRKCQNCPSFSSTLLDAIYKSIDENDTDTRGATKAQFSSSFDFSDNRRIIPPATNHRENVESAARLPPIRTTPLARSNRFTPDQITSAGIDERRSKKEKDHRQASIKSYLRDLRNGKSPASPGARLTNFLTSIFAAKSKVSAELPCSRSCLSKTPSTGKRTVRFCPASVILGEGCEKQGIKMKKMEEEEEEEEDLFELKNLGFIGRGRGRFRDELPVFETAIISPGVDSVRKMWRM